MTIPRRVTQAGLSIVGSVLKLVFGTASDTPASGDHDHTVTGVGLTGATTVYRGGQATPPTYVTGAALTGTAGDFMVLFTGTGAQTYTLPPAGSAIGRTLVVWEWVGDGGTKTIARAGTEFINGVAASVTLAGARGRKTFYSDGSSWGAV